MQFRTQPLTDIRNQELIPPPPQSLLFPKSVSHLGFFPPPNSMGLRLEIGCKEIVRGFERISLSHLFFCFTYFTAWCVLIDGVMGHIPCMEYLLEIKKKIYMAWRKWEGWKQKPSEVMTSSWAPGPQTGKRSQNLRAEIIWAVIKLYMLL